MNKSSQNRACIGVRDDGDVFLIQYLVAGSKGEKATFYIFQGCLDVNLFINILP
jgi:hypothetical protein